MLAPSQAGGTGLEIELAPTAGVRTARLVRPVRHERAIADGAVFPLQPAAQDRSRCHRRPGRGCRPRSGPWRPSRTRRDRRATTFATEGRAGCGSAHGRAPHGATVATSARAPGSRRSAGRWGSGSRPGPSRGSRAITAMVFTHWFSGGIARLRLPQRRPGAATRAMIPRQLVPPSAPSHTIRNDGRSCVYAPGRRGARHADRHDQAEHTVDLLLRSRPIGLDVAGRVLRDRRRCPGSTASPDCRHERSGRPGSASRSPSSPG